VQASRPEASDIGAPSAAAVARGVYQRVDCPWSVCAATLTRRACSAAQPADRAV